MTTKKKPVNLGNSQHKVAILTKPPARSPAMARGLEPAAAVGWRSELLGRGMSKAPKGHKKTELGFLS